MAKNVLLAWTNPANVADIDTIDIYRINQDLTNTTTTDDATFRSQATLIASEQVGSANSTQNYTDSAVSADIYTYGAYSKNAGGYGPGDRIDTALVVT